MNNPRKPLFASIVCTIAAAGLTVALPVARAQSQFEMNEKVAKEYKAADARLNQVYQTLLKKIDKQSQTKLKKAQLAWLAYRDAQADFYADATARGGSILPMVYSDTGTALTQARTKELEKALKESAL